MRRPHWPSTLSPARFGLRWMTPTMEVPLCGHATLASAHTLFDELGVEAPALAFDTQSGALGVRRAGGRLEMDFPADRPRRIEAPAGLAEALGAQPVEVWAGRFLVAVLTHEDEVRGLKPDLAALQSISSAATQGLGNVGVAALAAPGGGYDVVDRFFAPGSGIPEDPATGGLHCSLGPLFADKLGKPLLRFYQAYPDRGGDIEAEVAGDRVLLRGQAVTVAESRLRL